MDLKKQKPSGNFVDTTDDTPLQRYLTNLMQKFNPVTAYRKTRSDLIDRGIIEIPGADKMAEKAIQAVKDRMTLRDQYISAGLTPQEADLLISSGK